MINFTEPDEFLGDVLLIQKPLKGVKKGRNQLKVSVLASYPSYRGVL